jgi:hypothetical protein
MSLTIVNTNQNEAEQKYGYRFGCEGLVTLDEAAAKLRKSVRSVYRLIEAGELRYGGKGKTVICQRSLMDYIAGTEK